MTKTCLSCHRTLQLRLRSHLHTLELLRRGFHITPVLQRGDASTSKEVGEWLGSLYFDSLRPTREQSAASSQFFASHTPRKAWVANEWRNQHPPSQAAIPSSTMLTPEIAFLGRSNTGKSSLLNALLRSPELCRVGAKPGKTIAMHAWALAPSDPRTGGATKGTSGDTDAKLTVLDMPGYGHGSRNEWGEDIMKYLQNRKQLKRAFVLLNPKHGLKESDEQILQMLRTSGISHQIIACKCDTVKPAHLQALLLDLRQKVKEGQGRQGGMGVALDDILAVGKLGDGSMNKKVRPDSMLGISEVRWAVLRAVGLEEYAQNKMLEHRKKKQKVPGVKAEEHKEADLSKPSTVHWRPSNSREAVHAS